MKSCGESTTACVPEVLVASLLRAMAPARLLEAVDNVPQGARRFASARHDRAMLEPIERERRTRHVAQYVLEALAVTTVERDLGVDIDASDLSERALDGMYGAHGLHELERTLTSGVAEELQVSSRGRLDLRAHRAPNRRLGVRSEMRRGRVAGRQHGLVVRELRRLVAEAVERATVRAQHASEARVRPRGDLCCASSNHVLGVLGSLRWFCARSPRGGRAERGTRECHSHRTRTLRPKRACAVFPWGSAPDPGEH